MSILAEIRAFVRQRANFACEYCGVTEVDVGGELTIDHFQPHSKGGSDELDNLVYCCNRCNQHKLDYWPSGPEEVPIWNPRLERRDQHWLELEDGRLQPVTPIGAFTVHRLGLNRVPLILYRLRNQQQAEEKRLLERYIELASLQEKVNTQIRSLLEEQNTIIAEQQALLRLLIRRRL